jgi:hypothetical protein
MMWMLSNLSGVLAGSANAGDRKVVRLELKQVSTGAPIIIVNPPHAKIWRKAPGKAQEIRWWMKRNRTSYYEIVWEFRYDPTKKGAAADYFGEVDLGCGETRVDALPKMKPDSPNAEWPYTITAYACHKGKKA